MRTPALLTLILLLMALPLHGTVKIGVFPVGSSNQDYLQYVRYMTVPATAQSGSAWNAGNSVTGKTVDQVQQIVDAIKALETNPVQREIYDKMQASSEVFQFNNATTHAKSTVLQRLKGIEMMENFNTDFRYDYWDDKHPPSTNASKWANCYARKILFKQISGNADAAINQITLPGSKTYGECFGACITCVWWGGLQGMLAQSFDALYSGAAALNMDDKISGSPFYNTKFAADNVIVPGDWVYFNNYNYTYVINVPGTVAGFYHKKWLSENAERYYWSGENAIYMGKTLYSGLGGDENNVTEAQMREIIRNVYNRDLAKVITGLDGVNGLCSGIPGEIKEITPATANTKIQIINVRRVFHN